VSTARRNRPRRTSERCRERLGLVRGLHARGLSLSSAVRGVGIHRCTAFRWRRRESKGQLLSRPRGPHVQPLSITACTEAASVVQAMHGLIGADALRHSVPGLTRRTAAAIKSDTCRLMEHERRLQAERVTVVVPGILRSFDAMELGHRGAANHALIAADGCVPFRTSWTIANRYDGDAVANILGRDFEAFGAPLVLRLDRARAHDVPAVRAVLQEHQVLALHGPSHYAPYYGQLERQNREHRAWLAASNGALDCDQMMAALNGLWRRSTLGWRTAEELWQARPRIHMDRQTLAAEVNHRAARLRRRLGVAPATQDLAWRLAVKQALVNRRLLRIEKGGWC
jgi:hypothetical protein